MPAQLPLSDFHDLYSVKGAGSPIVDEASGGRDLTLLGSGTAPRSASYKRRRGAEFRSSSFAATAPRAFGTDSPGTFHTTLYVGSKIQSFTLCGWFKPQKTGVTAVYLTPIGGLFSASNMGATPWMLNQPIFLFTRGVAGASPLVVSAYGSVLDTRVATQTKGPTTTTPIADNDYSYVAVRVTGSASVNNQVDAVTVLTMTSDGVVRVYQLGEHKAAVTLQMSGTKPSDGQTLTIQGRARTWKTTLTGTPATGQITYGGAGVPTDGETVVVGEDSAGNPLTYTWRDYVGAGEAATVVVEFASSGVIYGSSTPKTQIKVGGWAMTLLWGTKYPDTSVPGGLGFGGVSSDTGGPAAEKVFQAWHGDWDGSRDFRFPTTPETGEFDAGKAWASRRIIPGTSTAILNSYSEAPVTRTIPLRVADIGTAGNAVKVAVLEPPSGSTAYTKVCSPCRIGRNNPFLVRLRAPKTDLLSAANGGAGSVANGSYKYAYSFVHASGDSVESNPTSHTVTGGPRAVDLTAIPVGPSGTTARKIWRTKVNPTATSPYFLLTTIANNTATTYTDTTADASLPATELPTTMYMMGGLAAAGVRSVKIDGGSWANCRDNFIKAINASGTPGTHYSADITTANLTCSAAASGNDIALTSKLTGSAGNGKPLSEATGCISGVVAFAGGGAGTNDEVLIGATEATAWENMAAAINKTGAAGIQYGDNGALTIDAFVTAAIEGALVTLKSKESGTTGNGRTVATTATGVVIRDEFNDKTHAALVGGMGAPPFTVAAGARPDQSDLRFLWGGWNQTAQSTAGIFYGIVSDVGIANRVLDDEESVLFGLLPPPFSQRDVGWFRAASKVRIAAKTERQSAFPVPRALATGAASQTLPLGIHGTRASLRLVGVEAGRPWAIDALLLEYEGQAGIMPASHDVVRFPGFSGGVNKSAPPSKTPIRSAYDLLNASYQGGYFRRRRGSRILNNESTGVAAAACAYYDATNALGDTYHLVIIAGTLYQIDNGELLEIDSGWPQDELPTVATVGLKTFIFSKSRRKIFQEGTLLDIGVVAPTAAPMLKTTTPNVEGGVVALPPGYEYVYTYFDGVKLTESGPSPVTLVVLPTGSGPSSITLSLGTSGSSAISARRVYRRKVATPDWFLVGELEGNTDTDFTDDSEIPATFDTLEIFGGTPVTAEEGDWTACAEHEGKLVMWGDPADRRRVGVSMVGDGERSYLYDVLQTKGEMRAAVSHAGRLVLLSDRSVEVVEGDWVHGTSGAMGIQQRLVDDSKGCFGPFAACSARGDVYWADANGVHRVGRGFDQQNMTLTVSEPVHPVIQDAVDTAGTGVVLAFNYYSQELWVLLSKSQPGASEGQDTKNRLVLVADLAHQAEAADGQLYPVWSIYDHALCSVRLVVDGLLGYSFRGVDYYGTVYELDILDGDGIEGNEAWLPATNDITSLPSAKTIRKSGAAFPTDGSLRGVAVVLEDVSEGEFYRTLILSNDADDLTLADLPSWVDVGDKFYVGGIIGRIDTKEIDGGRPVKKRFGPVEVGLADCTSGRF